VDSARVGQRTDFDKLALEVETDGSIEPGSAVREAAEILIKSLAIFTDADRVEELTARDTFDTVGAGADPLLPGAGPAADGDDRLIEELEVGVRAYNCLKRAGIQTVGDLVQRSESELNAIPNFGRRSTEEVIDALHQLGLSLRGE
ncbi:MAG TPA: DNA-directed RNA polymerase subunit alpha C-terminal domain-containing protein, partial [Solirubrobacterales bacterium]|nr:DNA-directed RNA polymerase subunit alpha C-terminal domain-containing protein [Solirubrobacterales bacterium]